MGGLSTRSVLSVLPKSRLLALGREFGVARLPMPAGRGSRPLRLMQE